ncbi:hypothetical protein SAMN02949497_0198 [Methylomagnum ishizawai]|uniref:UPF0276 protein SAMN02949497_0198 n=1 Tax=Methylomagnum ishizawai TaxID=1760988 RepID=A0A1Y6D3W5_9GAMM|nr:DUF692 domain-containing protein [Methylomagnum ishizawai]SMF97628.1 hypothetical protein SAMN02949497_0198 [Methylomagnum ishizawai]
MDAVAQSLSMRRAPAAIPAQAGIGLRAEHWREAAETAPAVGWLEVHSENYFGGGGPPLASLERFRADYPISLHGVGLSLGSVDALDEWHLARLKRLIGRIEPGLVSEHLSWGAFGGRFHNDLLPLPYTEEALDHCVERLLRVQEFLGRRLLIENPSSYLEYTHSTLAEWDFLAEAARRSGAGILLDVNNLYVSCQNHGWDAHQYLRGIPGGWVGEIHLAGHTRQRFPEGDILIDTHDQAVCPEVWTLYAEALALAGPKPTLVEWDAKLPPLAELVAEAHKAQRLLEESAHAHAA